MKSTLAPKSRTKRASRIPAPVFDQFRQACEKKGADRSWSAADLVRDLRKGR
ncbi:MAG: hypothetical protein IPK32_22635 [Verrucomicrobiaceae bacterium]|nr:hypothetical protein [Verrucomicrobiaceae bacterium]